MSSAKQELQALEVDGVREVKIGTLCWLIALVGSVLFEDQLKQAGFQDAKWICLAGIFLGILGIIYTRRRANRLKFVSEIIDS
ncbi:MAG: DUF2530 domain-containing protein [Actinomycetales bacterium]|nr:DUF2530 domain-containing protein [Actinomycetales bacterium]